MAGVSHGLHEITNYLHQRFCTAMPYDTLCQIIRYNDDAFSHWLFFSSFILANGVLMLLQALVPYRGTLGVRDQALLAGNGLVIGVAIMASLAFEPIGLDLYVIALLLVFVLALLRRRGRQPLLLYYAVACGFGFVTTLGYKVIGALR